jgi:hypothetical protein
MGGAALHIIKLSVGSESMEDHAGWVAARVAERRAAGLAPVHRHVTRMWPKRAAEIAGRGSLYWVVKGLIRMRQTILGFEETDAGDGIRRCAILLDPAIVAVQPRPRAAFQGWRYLADADAPQDLAAAGTDVADLPPGLRQELDMLGVRLTARAA